MKKILLISCLLLVTVIAVSCAPTATPTPTAKPIVLKGDTLLLETHWLSILWTDKMKEMEQRSQGRLKFDISYNATLTPLREALNSLKVGALDWTWGNPGYYTGQDARFEICAVPFAFKDNEDAWKAMRTTPLGGMMEAALNKFNVTLIGYGGTSSYLTLSKKPVRTMEDLKGLKLRSATTAQFEAIKRLGATPVNVVTAEVYPAMEKGIIDACWLNYANLETYKLIELVKCVNEIRPITTTVSGLFFNLDTWNKIPKDLQDVIRKTVRDWEPKEIDFYGKEDNKYREMAIKAGIEIVKADEKETKRWREVAGVPVWEWIANRMESEDAKVFMKVMKEWHGIK